MKNKLLVTDIETTGFQNQGGSIVEVGIVELNLENGEINILLDKVCREKRLTKEHRKPPFGWIFENSTLTIEDVRNGTPFEEVKEEAQEIVNSYELGITAFNRPFDINFLTDRGMVFPKLQPCPMRIMTPICKLPKKGGYGGYKWPKVEEAWKFLFPDVEYNELHRGADDAVHEAKIIYELYKRGDYALD